MNTASRGRAHIGVLVPYTNTNVEQDMILLRPPGVSLHFQRMGGYDLDEIPDEGQMADLGKCDLSEPLKLLAGARPDIVLYGCTSATLAHGPAFDRELAATIRETVGVPSVTAAGSLVACMKALGVKRIGFSSPYVGAINDLAVGFFADAGIETVSRADIGRGLGNYGQGELTPDEVYELAARADSAEADAVVLSCTDMRAVETIERLEADLGKPVIASNQAMLHQALLMIGIDPSEISCGMLFRLNRAA